MNDVYVVKSDQRFGGEGLASYAGTLARKVLLSAMCFFSGLTLAQSQFTVWPTISFIRGQDLCQFQDAYGQSRRELGQEMTSQLKELLNGGVASRDAVEILKTMDRLIDKNRTLASTGYGMDVTLEGSLKASIDSIYRQINPKEQKFIFYNPVPLLDLLRDLREQKRQGTLDLKQLSKLSGFVWGTYSFAPSCKGEILATIHVEVPNGNSINFQAQGHPESVMFFIASRVVEHFQRTHFPSVVNMNGKSLQLVGAPGAPVSKVPSPQIAEKACTSSKTRLPLFEEYEYLSALGEWNGGVDLDHKIWALADGHVLAPDLRNPSPIRHPEEVNSDEIYFYCVR
jgi:hypothetical protein